LFLLSLTVCITLLRWQLSIMPDNLILSAILTLLKDERAENRWQHVRIVPLVLVMISHVL